MLRIGTLTLLVASLSTTAFAATCSVEPFNALPGTDTSTHMVVHTGLPCSIQMTVRGGGMEMTIGQQAANGKAITPGPTSFAYLSHPGFIGKDRFEADFTGELMESGRNRILRGTSHITVDVDVVR